MDLESLQKEVRAILFSPYKIAGHMIKYQYLFDDEKQKGITWNITVILHE